MAKKRRIGKGFVAPLVLWSIPDEPTLHVISRENEIVL